MIDVEDNAMSKPSDSKAPGSSANGVDRRRLFMMGGSAVAAAAVVPLAGSESLADNEAPPERLKARYKETDHVKNYYRVNRY
jgi:hypothetical protein